MRLGTIGAIIIGVIAFIVIAAVVVFLVTLFAPVLIGLIILTIIIGVGFGYLERLRIGSVMKLNELTYITSHWTQT